MGLPALKHEPAMTRSHTSRPSLRSVPAPSANRKKRPACSPEVAAARRFRSFAVVVAVIALLGMGRVWLSVQAAESSLRSGELRHAIKAARYEGDMLEIRLSALASPSRIEAVAGSSMGMTEAREVAYIDISSPERGEADTGGNTDAQSAARDRGTPMNRVVADALDLAATEAQILLVGDVGLASTR